MRQSYLIPNRDRDVLPGWLLRITLDEVAAMEVDNVSCLLLDATDWRDAYDCLGKIRRHPQPSVYLTPVVLVARDQGIPDEIGLAFDSVIQASSINEQAMNELAAGFESINRWTAALEQEKQQTDRNIAVKLLRYFASRGLQVSALTSLRSKSGFLYPRLEPFLASSDDGVLQTLEFLEQQHLIAGEFQTKARFCSHCHSAFLNFKEVCVHCGSEDLHVDELVHHFKCGYSAELADYKRGDDLVCPKCDRVLRHIGVDYDKPSIMYRCNSCAHAFQEPSIMTTCFSCGRNTEPENQLIKSIKKYTITAMGQHAAKFGLENLFASILDSEVKLTPYRNFLQFLKIEAARIERYKISNSSLLLVYLKGLENLYVSLGARAGSMFKELSAVIHSVLRSSDVITAKDEAVFAIALTETTLQQAEVAIERLRTGIDELLTVNLGQNLELETSLLSITPELDLNTALEKFLEQVGD